MLFRNMRLILILIVSVVISCTAKDSRKFNFASFRDRLRQYSLLTEKEMSYLYAVDDNSYVKDSIISILRNAFVQDFPPKIQASILENKSTVREALKMNLYPSPEGFFF